MISVEIRFLYWSKPQGTRDWQGVFDSSSNHICFHQLKFLLKQTQDEQHVNRTHHMVSLDHSRLSTNPVSVKVKAITRSKRLEEFIHKEVFVIPLLLTFEKWELAAADEAKCNLNKGEEKF